MARRGEVRAEAARLLALCEATGAEAVEADVLQPAETLLDLYGEDIRARAYVTADPLRGEQMLRPDFTVPIVQRHMARGAGAARYCYAGKVFRRQEQAAPGRPSEYLQAGLELIGGRDPAADEAEVFGLFAAALASSGLRAAIGDIGLLRAAVTGLETSAARRTALMRHLWRPRRFRALLERYGQAHLPEHRRKLLEDIETSSLATALAQAGPLVGSRSAQEIAARVEVLRRDAATPPIAMQDVARIDALLAVAGSPDAALRQLRSLARNMPTIQDAVDVLARRLDRLATKADLSDMTFEASFGRTSMEYYDGFVFGFFAPGRPDLPPVAGGGRYDALTRALGGGRSLPAVGGVIRPELVCDLRAEGAG